MSLEVGARAGIFLGGGEGAEADIKAREENNRFLASLGMTKRERATQGKRDSSPRRLRSE